MIKTNTKRKEKLQLHAIITRTRRENYRGGDRLVARLLNPQIHGPYACMCIDKHTYTRTNTAANYVHNHTYVRRKSTYTSC